jgi:hypothetical protein
VFIGHRWNSAEPPFPNAESVWLPITFQPASDAVAEMEWHDTWMLDIGNSVG